MSQEEDRFKPEKLRVVFGGKIQFWDLAAVQPFFSLHSYLGEAKMIVAVETNELAKSFGGFGSFAWKLASSNGETFIIEDLRCCTMEELVLKAGIIGCLAD